ncbi:VOC family protein [Thalassolituus sp. LLYu03]|uniref:VOC family protein n=1 Tax=Thalassolituus sp. LLYu03 TaxID=3421656 RepID=UPI003D2B01C9
MTDKKTDIFNQINLGYVVIESRKMDQWRSFLVDGIGLHLAQNTKELMTFRMDDHACRLVVRNGPAEDVVAFGWELAHISTLEVIRSRLKQHNIDMSESSSAEAASRGVENFWKIRGPKDIAFEYYTQAIFDNTPLKTPISAFETGSGGMGHAAIISRVPEKMQAFFSDIMDARVTDYITQAIAGVTLDFTFMRFNERHHTVAIAASQGIKLDPIRTRIQHMNLMVETVEDLTGALQRVRKLGYEVAREIGRHPNDHDISFYVVSPSGFEFEVGWNARTVDEASWKVQHYDRISQWGHKPQNPGLINFLRVNSVNLWNGILSLTRKEHSPL